MRCRTLMGALGVAVLTAACASAPSSNVRKPDPAGTNPSPIALEVCAHEAQSDLASDLGVKAVVKDRAWVHHRYSCRYVYPSGTIQLSVQELSSWSQTFAYYHGLGKDLGDTEFLGNLGQGAFRTDNGDVVVRKDWKVLLVNIAGLPGQFGVPPTSASDVAYTVADVILACWAGD